MVSLFYYSAIEPPNFSRLYKNFIICLQGKIIRNLLQLIESQSRFGCQRLNIASHPHRERLGAGLVCVGACAGTPALEAALEQAHQAGVPVADDEQESRNGAVK